MNLCICVYIVLIELSTRSPKTEVEKLRIERLDVGSTPFVTPQGTL